MTKNGAKQEIATILFESTPQMVIQIGGQQQPALYRIDLGTEVEYLKGSEWVAGKVLTHNSIQVDEEVIELGANITIRLKKEPSTVGLLVYDTLYPDIEYSDKDLQMLLKTMYGSGFINDYLFGTVQATGGLQITVSGGNAVIDGQVVFFREPQKINVNNGYTTVRKDLLVLRRNYAEKASYLAIKEGVPNVKPQAPELEQVTDGIYEIAIAEITVQPNVQSISQSDIKDVRRQILTTDEVQKQIQVIINDKIPDVYDYREKEGLTNKVLYLVDGTPKPCYRKIISRLYNSINDGQFHKVSWGLQELGVPINTSIVEVQASFSDTLGRIAYWLDINGGYLFLYFENNSISFDYIIPSTFQIYITQVNLNILYYKK